ncbi:CarD family transcriptional regulator [Bradyrhizobium liaoningense]
MMLYGVAIVIAAIGLYWLWGMRKMARMNNDPEQLILANLLLKAGGGDDTALLSFIREERWTQAQLADRVAHALSLAQRIFAPSDYFNAKTYAGTLQGRYEAFETGERLKSLGTVSRENVAHTENARTGDTLQHEIKVRTNSPTPLPILERQGFEVNEFVVYPAHGVGQILAIEEQEIAGAKLELFVINFIKDKMTLRVPTAKVANVGMRKLSDPETAQEAYRALNQQPQMSEATWADRSQEYESKINSGAIVAIAEVVRDLYQPVTGNGQSYSERQLFEAALDRLSRELALVEHITEQEALKRCESLVTAAGILRESRDGSTSS